MMGIKCLRNPKYEAKEGDYFFNRLSGFREAQCTGIVCIKMVTLPNVLFQWMFLEIGRNVDLSTEEIS